MYLVRSICESRVLTAQADSQALFIEWAERLNRLRRFALVDFNGTLVELGPSSGVPNFEADVLQVYLSFIILG